MARLAFYTFGLLANSYEHPNSQEFFQVAYKLFDLLPQTPGFIAMYPRDVNTPAPRFVDKNVDMPIATLTLWSDLRSAFQFTYTGLHAQAIPRKHEWVEKVEQPAYVSWWIGDEEEPTYEEAIKRYEYYVEHGSSPYAFTFKQAFDAEGNPTKVQKA